VDKVYKVLFVGGIPGYGTELSELDSKLGIALPSNGSDRDYLSVTDIKNLTFAELADYSFVLWHISGGNPSHADAPQAAAMIMAAGLPVMIFDGEGFPVSELFGLVDGGSGSQASGNGNKVEGDTDDSHGNGLYHVVLRNLVDFPENGNYEPLFGNGGKMDWGDSQAMGKILYWVDQTSLTRYTRALLQHFDANEGGGTSYPNHILAQVNDKKRIVASGIRDTSGDPLEDNEIAGILFKEMVEYVAAVGPEYGNTSHWMDGPALEAETESSMFSPSGQVVLTETDWTQESRGFDFTLARTYRSGSFEMYNALGPNWYYNHDRYIVHDIVNDQLYIHDGTGQVVTMELVQERILDPITEEVVVQPTYLAVNSSITDIAVYREEENEFTRDNPSIGAYAPGSSGYTENSENCIGNNHAGLYVLPQTFSPGFTIHDSAGSVAFYRETVIIDEYGFNSTDPDKVCFATFGNQKLRTKGGELKYYKLAYVKDANGNRQNYYYGRQNSPDGYTGPEELLWCVVDTEGRGTYFQHSYYPTTIGTFILGGTGPTLPWLEKVHFYGGTTSHSEYTLYTHENVDPPCSQSSTYHGFLLSDASLGGRQKEYSYDFSAYDLGPIGCSPASWSNHITPLDAATDWEGTVVHRYWYGDVIGDTYSEGYDVFHSPKLERHTTGSDGGGTVEGVPLDRATDTWYESYIKPGSPNQHNDRLIYGWVSAVKDNIGHTALFNGSFHVIEHRMWYTEDRCDFQAGQGYACPSFPGDPGHCSDHSDPPDELPNGPCEKKAWIWTYYTNVDGQVVKAHSPDGIITQSDHLLDWALDQPGLGLSDNLTAHDSMHLFWSEFWHLRWWLANEVRTVMGSGGDVRNAWSTFEPIYNQSLTSILNGVVVGRMNYDYIYQNTNPSLDEEEMLTRMGLGHKKYSDTDMWFDTYSEECPYLPLTSLEDCPYRIFHALPWGECENGTAPIASEEEGNMVCETRPASTGFESVVDPGDEVSATYSYDSWGRQTWINGFEGETTNVLWYDLPTHGMLYAKVVTRDPLGEQIQTGYQYNDRGENILKVLKTSPKGDCAATHFTYDDLGQVVETKQQLVNCSGAYDDGPIERLESYSYDDRGNLVLAETQRDPEETGDFDDAPNRAGTVLRHLKLHDSKNRVLMDCKEIWELPDENDPIEHFSCTVNQYNWDDRLRRQGTFAWCELDAEETDPEELMEAIRSCLPSSWEDFDYVVEHAYDQRRLRHSTITAATEEDEDRESLMYYDPVGRLRAVMDPENSDGVGGREWTVHEYDGLGRLVRTVVGVTNPLDVYEAGVTATAYEYDDFDNVIRETRGEPYLNGTDKAAGHVERYYDERNELLAERSYQYPVGDPSEDDAQTTYFFRDDAGRVTTERVEYPSSATVERVNTYDAVGRLFYVEDGFTNTDTLYGRDWAGHVVSKTVWHNPTDELLVADPTTTSTMFSYNGVGDLLARVEYGDTPRETIYRHDGYGFLVGSQSPNGRWTWYERDGLGRELVLRETEVNGSYEFDYDDVIYNELVVFTDYDKKGNLIARVDSGKNYPSGRGTTYFSYNAHSEVMLVDQPSAESGQTQRFTKAFERNGEGAVIGIEYSDGRGFELELDRFNRPVLVESYGGASQRFDYDVAGNVVDAQDNNHGNSAVSNVRTVREFDSFSNLTSDHIFVTATSENYDYRTQAAFDGSRMKQLVTPQDVTMKYSYKDDLGLLDKVAVNKFTDTQNFYNAAKYEWLGAKPLDTLFSTPDGWANNSRRYDKTTDTAGYDAFGDQVLREDETLYQGSPLTPNPEYTGRYEFGYNANGRLTAENDLGDGLAAEQKDYGLDELDRVTSFESDSRPYTEFALDQVNNIRVAAEDGGVTRTFTIDQDYSDGINRISSIDYSGGGGTRTFTYDDSGNTLTDSGGPVYPGRTFTWDDHGRLVEVEVGTGAEWRKGVYAYDAFNRRVMRYVHDDYLNQGLADRTEFRLYGDDEVEWLIEPHNPAMRKGVGVAVNDPTAVDRYVVYQTYSWFNNNWIYHWSTVPVTDRRNNVVALVTTGGVDPDSIRSYDLHGLEVDTSYYYAQPHRFAGRVWDEESDLYYYRSRYYDPSLGRFISVDTIGIWGDLNNYGNGYAYVGNMGNSGLDPWGFDGCGSDTTPSPGGGFWEWLGALLGVMDDVDTITTGGELLDDVKKYQSDRILDNAALELLSNSMGQEVSLEKLEKKLDKKRDELKNEKDKEKRQDLQWDIKKLERAIEIKKEQEKQQQKEREERERKKKGGGNQRTVDDETIPMSKEEWQWLSATGRIKAEPSDREKTTEYWYERDRVPLQLQMKWREQKKRPSIDGRSPYMSWWKFQAPVVNWKGRMGLLPGNRSGVIDPIPASRW
jgi:RHS repeat-associated protein